MQNLAGLFATMPTTEGQMVAGTQRRLSNELMAGNEQAVSVLQQAIAGDSAPTVEFDPMRGAGMAGGIGAGLLGLLNPNYATQFAQQQQAVQRANAQAQMQAELANQTQEGYLKMRNAERESQIASLRQDASELRAKLNAELSGLKITEAAQARKALKEANAVDQREELKWLQTYADPINGMIDQIMNGVPGEDGAPRRLSEVEAQQQVDVLETYLSYLSPDSQTYQRFMERIDSALKFNKKNIEDAKTAAAAALEAEGGGADQPGPDVDAATLSERIRERDRAGGQYSTETMQRLDTGEEVEFTRFFGGRGGLLGPLDLDLIREATESPEIQSLTTGVDGEDMTAESPFRPFDRKLEQERNRLLNSAFLQSYYKETK